MTRDSDLHQRMLTLAENLHEATKAGKISWALTDREDKFLYAGTKSSVTIGAFTDRDGDNHSTLSLLNSRGTTVDSLESEFEARQDGGYAGKPWNDLLEDLYHAARRVAHDVDGAIDSMLDDIEKGTPSPPPPKNFADDPWAKDASFSDEPPF